MVSKGLETVLVVECGKCGTRFQLDSSRIPDSGIRVRCSRCKHAFHLQPPAQSQAAAVDAVVEEAIEHESTPVPSATQNLPIASSEPDPGESAAAVNAYGGFEDEDDWEFNEDPPSDDDDEDELESSAYQTDDQVDFDLEGDDGDIGVEGVEADVFGEESANDHSYELADGPATTDLAEASVSSMRVEEIGDVDLAESSASIARDVAHDIPALAEDVAAAPGFGGECEQDAFGTVEDFSSLDDESQPSDSPSAMAKNDVENIEDPESWDFFGDDSPASPGGGGAAQTEAVAAAIDQATQQLATESHFDSDSDWQDLDADSAGSAVSRIASALTMVAVFGLLGAGVYLGVVGSFNLGVRTPAFVDIGNMRAANVRAQWVETERVGTLYVVSGDLVNPGTTAAAPGQAVRVSLVDDSGANLGVASAFAGSGVEIDFLRNVSFEQLLSSSEVAARTLATQPIQPGKSARFAAAFVDLPDDASHFQVSAVDREAIGEWAAEMGIGSDSLEGSPELDTDPAGIPAKPALAEVSSLVGNGAHPL